MHKSAAVLIGIINSQIILTKRAAHLSSFTGHICLPGGKYDMIDQNDMTNTAIREFNEEVYFTGTIDPLFCMLPEVSIVSGQSVYPVIATLKGNISGFNPDEVEHIIFMKLAELLPANFYLYLNLQYPTIKHNQCIKVGEEIVWGLTAHILYELTYYYNTLLNEAI